jgi:hypothetical protein
MGKTKFFPQKERGGFGQKSAIKTESFSQKIGNYKMFYFTFKEIIYFFAFLFFLNVPTHATKHKLSEEDQVFCLHPLTHPDVVPQIFLPLGERDQVALSMACHAWYNAIIASYQKDAQNFLQNPFGQACAQVFPVSKTLMSKGLERQLHTQGFLAIPHGSALAFCLNENFNPLSLKDLMSHYDASARLYRALFKEELECETQNISTKLQHLLAALPVAAVFIDRQEGSVGCDNFFNNLGHSLEIKLKETAGTNPHWSFSRPHSPERKKILKRHPTQWSSPTLS